MLHKIENGVEKSVMLASEIPSRNEFDKDLHQKFKKFYIKEA